MGAACNRVLQPDHAVSMCRYNIPVALACPLPAARLQAIVQNLSAGRHFNALVCAEDSGVQEVEFMYGCAAQRIERPPMRCAVIGDSNVSVEAAHELVSRTPIAFRISGGPSQNTMRKGKLQVQCLRCLGCFQCGI